MAHMRLVVISGHKKSLSVQRGFNLRQTSFKYLFFLVFLLQLVISHAVKYGH